MRVRRPRRNRSSVRNEALAEAVAAALVADRDPAANRKVQRIVTALRRIVTALRIGHRGTAQTVDVIAVDRFRHAGGPPPHLATFDVRAQLGPTWRESFNAWRAALDDTRS